MTKIPMNCKSCKEHGLDKNMKPVCCLVGFPPFFSKHIDCDFKKEIPKWCPIKESNAQKERLTK